MVHKQSTISEAYAILGLEEGSPLEVVRSAYKQVALRTHPDKNQDNPDATAQFQQVSEAYNVLVKHLSSDFEDDDSDFDYDYDDDDDFEEQEAKMHFYFYMFEEAMRGRAHRFGTHRIFMGHPPPPPETEEEYQERLRKIREEREAAAERRLKEEAARRLALEQEREKERKEAQQRQKIKASNKKRQAEANRKSAAQAILTLQERTQMLRSSVFAAARRGDTESVKKGIWEDGVDAAGGEVRTGSEQFVPGTLPKDPLETLMHIAAKMENVELVEWLDTHSAEADERDSGGMTPFHVALRRCCVPILQYFIKTYPPKESDSRSVYTSRNSLTLTRIALESREPEAVWTVLHHGLSTKQEVSDAWTWFCSDKGQKAMAQGQRGLDEGKLEEIKNLLMRFGGFTPPPTPRIGEHGNALPRSKRTAHVDSGSPSPASSSRSQSPPSTLQLDNHHKPQTRVDVSQKPSTQQPTPPPQSPLERFRQQRVPLVGQDERGKSRGRGRGRGRG